MTRLACSFALVTAVATGLAAGACGGPQSAPPAGGRQGTGEPGPRDTRSEMERRRDAACDQLAPKLVQCAVEDSRAELAAGRITQTEFDTATQEDGQRELAADWRKKCRTGYMSSRQVRVLEVCFREETACAPLEACLENLKTPAK